MRGVYTILIFLSFVVFAFALKTVSPVVLVAGDGGSQLEAKLNKSDAVHYFCEKKSSGYFNIWLNLELLVPIVIDCWIENTKLIYDNTTRTTHSPQGVDIRVPGWGLPEPVEWLDPSHASTGSYFHDIAESLVQMGYVRNMSIRGAPYDFRKGPNENADFFVKLKALIEDTYSINNNSAVTLVVHSMGGTMSAHFLRQQTDKWKDKYIKRMIALSSPWAGTMKAIKVYAIGDDLGSLVLRENIMRAQQITCPSLAWLMPSPLFWKPQEVLVQTDKFNYTINDLQKYFTDLDLEYAWELYKDLLKYSLEFSAPGVELHCLYGTGIPTVEKLYYKPGTWLDGYPTLIKGDGDGTVNARSLSACEHWKKRVGKTRTLNNNKIIKSIALPGAEHLKILHDKRVSSYIQTVLRNDV